MGAPPPAFREGLRAAGLNLQATLAAGDYDAAVPEAWRCTATLPGARTVIVVGSGGRALWEAFTRAPERALARDPLDAYTERVVTEAVAALAAAGHPSRALFAHAPREGRFADFVALGARAGLGASGRLGLLLHPDYGPWLSLRAVVLTHLFWRLPPRAPEGWRPCQGCSAPCERACPGRAPRAGGFDLGRCAATRPRSPECAESCASRHACVIGPNHAYTPAALAHHMRAVRLP